MRVTIFSFLFVSLCVMAADSEKDGKLGHESEAGVVIASGNSDTQTYSAKQATTYIWSGNTGKFTGSYLLGKTSGVETAKKWDLGVRFERELFERFSSFLGYQIDAAPYAGTYFRHTLDLGGKYDILKSDSTQVLAEVGYHLTAETFTLDNGASDNGSLTSHMSRAYFEWKQSWNKSVSTKLWAEYLQSFTNTNDYRFNSEPSVTVLMSEVFSLKLAYLINFRNTPAVAGKKSTDTLFTTSLVAKF